MISISDAMNPPIDATPQRHPAVELLARYRAIFQAAGARGANWPARSA